LPTDRSFVWRLGFPALTPHRRAGSCLTDPITIAPVHGIEPGTLHDDLRRIDRNRFATSSFVNRSDPTVAHSVGPGIAPITVNKIRVGSAQMRIDNPRLTVIPVEGVSPRTGTRGYDFRGRLLLLGAGYSLREFRDDRSCDASALSTMAGAEPR
jgi:hypothetical protein